MCDLIALVLDDMDEQMSQAAGSDEPHTGIDGNCAGDFGQHLA